MIAPTSRPAVTAEKTIERKTDIPSVAGEGARMPHIMCSIVDHVDMRKTDDADNEKTKSDGQEALQSDARARAGKQW